ncbi:MAG: CBS domain-containing protein [Granulosicoccus sp.]|nr:CBS domain-containing protein [Granulosicoccus sp.]
MIQQPSIQPPRSAQAAVKGYSDAGKSIGAPTSVSRVNAGSERLTSVSVGELMTTEPYTIEPTASVQLAASYMYEHHISCLPVVDGQQLLGLVTEADFVGRIVALGRRADEPVSEAMTENPIFVSPEHSVLDVLTLMTEHRIAHMPVCVEGQLVGIVTQTDIIRHQIASSVFIVGDIARMKSSKKIAEVVRQLPRLLCSLVDSGSSVYETGRVVSSITDAVTRRLLELAEAELGAAPVPYLWLACGSQGRQEQTGATDQDNCLILDDRFNADAHGDYFAQLANFVCDGLHESGYVYCPGDMMASNPHWRQPAAVWHEYFEDWIRKPGPTAQMLASVMFDLRPIQGEMSLYEPIRDAVLTSARSNSIFVAHMTTNCLAHRPPLGWFGRLKTEAEGMHRGMIDMKKGGVVPIIDLARLYALSAGIPLVNTIERLASGAQSPVLSQLGAENLLDAYEIMSMIRLRHQVRQIKRSEIPDNFVDPAQLISSERERLKRAMKTVKDIQSVLGNRVAVVGR